MLRNQSVFKVRKADEKVKDILQNNRIYLSSPSSFNDPFDATIPPIVDIDDEDYRKWYEAELKRNKLLNEAQRKSAEQMLVSGEYKSMLAKDGVVAGWREGLKKYGICSFAFNISNILLWSHYGDNHKGVAVGIEVQKLESKDHSLTEVHYSSEYPNVGIHEIKNYQEVLRRKYLCWEYEKEVRIIKKDSAGTFFELPENSIKQIVFGMNFPEEKFLEVFSWVNWNKMNPDIVSAVQIKGKYELRFVEKINNPAKHALNAESKP